MIQKLLGYHYEGVELIHVPMNYSSDLTQIGKLSVSKVISLLRVIFKGIKHLFLDKIDAVYYPPAGHNKIPVIRDIITLLIIRSFKKKLIFHFHALGLQNFYNQQSRFLQKLMKMAYGNPDTCVCLSNGNIKDIDFLNSKETRIIPYGVVDHFSSKKRVKKNDIVSILYLGNLYRSKGVACLLDAAQILLAKKIQFELNFVGGFKDEKFKRWVQNHPSYCETNVRFHGILTGQNKYDKLAKADFFCFPTNYENENFPVVLLEAMSFGLPLIGTDWRSVSDMVRNDENGILIDKQDPTLLAEALNSLIADQNKRQRLGDKSREIFKVEYSDTLYLQRFEELFLSKQ